MDKNRFLIQREKRELSAFILENITQTGFKLKALEERMMSPTYLKFTTPEQDLKESQMLVELLENGVKLKQAYDLFLLTYLSSCDNHLYVSNRKIKGELWMQ